MQKVKKKKINQSPLTLNDLGKFTEEVLLPSVKKVVKNDLCEFTEEVLLPAVEKIVDQKLDKRLAEQTHDMKVYIDSKMSENKGDIISYIKGDRERDKGWKMKIVNILKREKLVKPVELKILADLIR